MTDLDKKKIAFADAIIEEAAFNDLDIDLETMEIEHQLGTVWVGNVVIQPNKSFIDTSDQN